MTLEEKGVAIAQTIAAVREKQREMDALLSKLERTGRCYEAGFDPANVASSLLHPSGKGHLLKMRDGTELHVSSDVAASLRLLYGMEESPPV